MMPGGKRRKTIEKEKLVKQRLDEAVSTGAEALVTACPWCEKTFKDANGGKLEVYDIVELLVKSV